MASFCAPQCAASQRAAMSARENPRAQSTHFEKPRANQTSSNQLRCTCVWAPFAVLLIACAFEKSPLCAQLCTIVKILISH
mmetsp:Transcript_20731/g.32967  ORF Transcript_20731/g.32967 Transcript_20731/m.32967 type:complete len:81 (-) Transcript_20731:2190-2432(-)